MKKITLMLAIVLAASVTQAGGSDVGSSALTGLKKRLNLDSAPQFTEYVKLEGKIPGSSTGCIVTLENSKDNLDINISTDTLSDQFVVFKLPGSGKTSFGDNVSNFNYIDTGMLISLTADVIQNTSLQEKYEQSLKISINTDTVFTIKRSKRSVSCAISNF